jgi:hypothetical protein
VVTLPLSAHAAHVRDFVGDCVERPAAVRFGGWAHDSARLGLLHGRPVYRRASLEISACIQSVRCGASARDALNGAHAVSRRSHLSLL